MSNEGKVYLIVPGQVDSGIQTMTDDSVQDQGIGDKIKGFIGIRKEVETEVSTVQQQINSYVTIIKGVAEEEAKKEDAIKLSEITLSLRA